MEGFTKDQYTNLVNKLSTTMVELGVDLGDSKKRIVSRIYEITRDDSLSVEDKARETFHSLFSEQIYIYHQGCSWFTDLFANFAINEGIALNIATEDDINEKNDASQTAIVESTLYFVGSIGVMFESVEEMETINPDLKEKIEATISMFFDTAYTMGLTDARTVNYFMNNASQALLGKLTSTLNKALPSVF